ncbi:MAG: hypothetical protein KJO64_00305, partial [Bacteroidia bacterium]|nr:hypothetical protein [Bacteroidia bacterium]
NKITRHNATTGAYISDFAGSIGGPTRMKIGPDSLLYVLQWTGNGRVRRYDLSGNYIGEFTSVSVGQSIGLDWDQNNNLYVSSYGGALVRKFNSNGADQGLFINSNLQGPTNIWFDTNGDLLVADYNGTSVKRFDSTGNFINDFMTGLNNCEGVAMFPNGNILIGNGGNSSVKMFDSAGTYLSDFIPSGSGSLINPNAVVIRQNNSTGVTEPKSENAIIFTPNIGTEFFIHQKMIGELTSLEVFNIEGTFLEHIDFSQNNWNAEHLAPGNYMLIATLKNKNTITQQFVIR